MYHRSYLESCLDFLTPSCLRRDQSFDYPLLSDPKTSVDGFENNRDNMTSPGNIIGGLATQDLGVLTVATIGDAVHAGERLVRTLSQYSQVSSIDDNREQDDYSVRIFHALTDCFNTLAADCNRKTVLNISLQILYLVSALQPMLNAWAAANRLIAGYNCDANDSACFSQWHGSESGLVYFIAACTFYANYRIALEFMPDTLNTWWKILRYEGEGIYQEGVQRYLKRENWNFILLASLLLASSGAIVTYQLGVESLTIFRSLVGPSAGRFLDDITLFGAVFSTFSTRFMGARTMLSLYYERLLAYLYMDKWLSYIDNKEKEVAFYHDRRWLLTGLWEAFTYEYTMSDAMWTQFAENANKKNYDQADFENAFNVLYGDRERSLLSSVKPGFFSGLGYQLALLMIYFFVIASYPLIYNIAVKAFAEWADWVYASYFVACASTLFYFYAIGRLPDQLYRVVKMSNTFLGWAMVARWGWVIFDILVGAVACGNFLYSAMSQADDGKLDHWGMSRSVALIFFAFEGGFISGGCNIFATLSIGEKHAMPERRELSKALFDKLKNHIEGGIDSDPTARARIAEKIEKAHQYYSQDRWLKVFQLSSRAGFSSNQKNDDTVPLLNGNNV